MKTSNFSKLFALAMLCTLGLSASAANARITLDIDEDNRAPGISSWDRNGSVRVNADGSVRITEEGGDDDSLRTDVFVSSREAGDYAVLISYTKAEDVRRSGNVGGLPYIYGYFMDGSHISQYLQDGSMTNDAGDDEWDVSYGIFRIPTGTDSIRFFLMQASQNGTSQDGRAAWFYQPGLYLVDTRGEADDIVDAYRDRLDDVSDELGGTSSSNDDYYNDDVRDYSTGTLLKCAGRPAVYSVTGRYQMKLFPDENTFYAWGHSFQNVISISCSDLARYNNVGTWTYSRAWELIKFDDSPAVFTLDNGRYLRALPNERTAAILVGNNWQSRIVIRPANHRYNYVFSQPHPNRY